MPAKVRRHKPRRSGPLLATSLDPLSGEDDDGTIDEHTYDGAVYDSDPMPDETREAGPRQMPDETREADPREASSSAPRFSATATVWHDRDYRSVL